MGNSTWLRDLRKTRDVISNVDVRSTEDRELDEMIPNLIYEDYMRNFNRGNVGGLLGEWTADDQAQLEQEIGGSDQIIARIDDLDAQIEAALNS